MQKEPLLHEEACSRGSNFVAARPATAYTDGMEFCSIDPVTGSLTDAGMFADLDQVEEPVRLRRRSLARLRKQGLSDDAIRECWPGLASLLPTPLA